MQTLYQSFVVCSIFSRKICCLTSPSPCRFFVVEKLLNTYNTHSVLNLKKYADLHHPGVVCFFISKSMLTYITHTLSIFDFEKYADLHHPDVVCF